MLFRCLYAADNAGEGQWAPKDAFTAGETINIGLQRKLARDASRTELDAA